MDRWLAPDLGCILLEEEIFRDGAGGRAVLGTTRTLSIAAGEPAAGLFDIPAHYVERAPGEALELELAHRGLDCPECAANRNRQVDERYRTRRAAAGLD